MPRFLRKFRVALLLGFSSASTVHAFDSGSNGTFGPLVVPGGVPTTLVLPPDGILHCTTINIDGVLRFVRNGSNTPVYLLANGDVSFSRGSAIFVDGDSSLGSSGGLGGPGGFGGGQGGPNPSNGFGPGGGKGGYYNNDSPPHRGAGSFGAAGSSEPNAGKVYGNSLIIPFIGGSGGGGSSYVAPGGIFGGGGGGGAILIASNTKITGPADRLDLGVGAIYARGGTSQNGGGGSGGSIRLVAPMISGLFGLSVEGGDGGGLGRIRIDSQSNSLVSIFPPSAPAITAGQNMVVFPPNMPELKITQVAGKTITSTTDPVYMILPPGSPSTQSVQVQVKNFGTIVPLVAVATPEAGEAVKYEFQVDNTAGGTANGSVQIQLPASVLTRVDVWTR